jgi:hypothetical protein
VIRVDHEMEDLLAIIQAVAVAVDQPRVHAQLGLLVVIEAVFVGISQGRVAVVLDLVLVRQAVAVGIPERAIPVGAEGDAVAVGVMQRRNLSSQASR